MSSDKNPNALAKFVKDDGHTIFDGKMLANECIEHFRKTLSSKPSPSLLKDTIAKTMLQFVDPCLSSNDAIGLDALFSKGGAHYGLLNLRNNKTLRLDGLNMAFFVQY